MELDKMDVNDWKYHGEGNKSLVVSHVQHSRVLRLLKYSAEDPENTAQTSEQALRRMQNIVDMSQHVMSPLLGEKFVHNGEVVKLPLEFVQQLSLKVQPERPESRSDKVIDIYSGYALCLPNLTQIPSCHLTEHRPALCIEVKPKCGFLPASRNVTKDLKAKVCRFCMHQHLKLASGKWKRLSRYCPLDLFSGNKQRMYMAIKSLLEEPQNNFKIFKGGRCIYGCKEDGEEELQDLSSLLQHLRPYFLHGHHGHPSNKALLSDLIQVIVSALLSSWEDKEEIRGEGRKTVLLPEGRGVCEGSLLHRELLRNANQGLPKDCVLARILQTQMLDSLDIEGVYPLYRRVEQHLHTFPKERSRLQVDGPYDQAFLEKLQSCPLEDDDSIEYAVGKVQQYCVAMTAKDCSIMIALAPCSEEEDDEGCDPGVIQTAKPLFLYSVSILDLDPKPYHSLPHQHCLDANIVSFYHRTSGPPQPDLPAQNRYPDDCTLLFHPV